MGLAGNRGRFGRGVDGRDPGSWVLNRKTKTWLEPCFFFGGVPVPDFWEVHIHGQGKVGENLCQPKFF